MPAANDIADRVKRIISDHLGLVVVDDSAHILDDLGADSLDTVELVMEFEAEFGIEIPDADMETLGTVAEAIAIVTRLTAS